MRKRRKKEIREEEEKKKVKEVGGEGRNGGRKDTGVFTVDQAERMGILRHRGVI